MPETKRANIQAVAAAAGVSKATVSRALRNLPGQTDQTRRRILAAARKLGYKSHPIMSAVMSSVRFKRTSDFSPVIAEIHCQPLAHKRGGNMALLRDNIHAQADELGYRVEEFNWYEPGMPQKRLLEIIRARGIRGVILEYFMESEVSLAGLRFDDLAVVSIGGALLKPKFHRVEVNHYGNLLKAIRLLRSRGYRRFGLVIPDIYERPSDFKRDAALHSAHQMLDVDKPIPIFNRNSGLQTQEFSRWLQRHRPDCILGVGTDIPEQLTHLGYHWPEKIGFAHLGWHPSYQGRAGINPKWSAAGKVAVNLVVDQLNRNEHGVPEDPLWVLIEGEWVEGPSVRPPRARVDPVEASPLPVA